MKCGDIQNVLFDYLAGELDPARSDLVRDHLRKCEKCQAAAAEIRATMDWLKLASTGDTAIPARLSEDRQARIVWALTHPVLDWIYAHHVIVSVVAALVASVVGTAILLSTRPWKGEEDRVPVNRYPVNLTTNHNSAQGAEGRQP